MFTDEYREIYIPVLYIHIRVYIFRCSVEANGYILETPGTRLTSVEFTLATASVYVEIS